jgi:hypothetical protein
MRMRIIGTILLAAGMLPATLSLSADTGQVYINEVMQSAVGGDIDLLMEYPDGWVELYNSGTAAVSLKGYRIGKKIKFGKCYELPDVTIPAKGYLVIYCDKADTYAVSEKKDRFGRVTSVEREVHTDFRLTTDAESGVYLYTPDAVLVDSVHLPVMFKPNVGYGRLSDGDAVWGYEFQPTKGRANEGGHPLAVLPDPYLSPAGYLGDPDHQAVFVKNMRMNRLKMSNGENVPNNAVVRYTTDGTEPCDTSEIMTSAGVYVDKNTIFKAAIFCDGYLTPDALTAVYLFHPRKLTLPTVSLVYDSLDMFSPEYGIIALNTKETKYNWRRPANFTYFGTVGLNPRINQICEVRVAGGWTRDNSQKTLIAYAHRRFGSDDYFDQAFWPTTRPEAYRAPSIMLRNSGNDFGNSFIRDGVAQAIVGMNTDLDWQGYQPAIYYINGKYDGLINIRERSNEDNVWTHYNGLEDITLIENAQLKEGDWQQYQDFVDFYSAEGHTYEEFDSVMDIVEYTNMMICNIFMSNTDFPGNNNTLWRPVAEGGRWRWIIKDVDRAFGIWGHAANEEYLKWVLNLPSNISSGERANGEYWTRLFRRLMSIERYRDLFLDMFTVYMGDFLTPEYMKKWITWAHDRVEPEYEFYSRVQRVNGKSSWENEINRMKNWTDSRWEDMYRQLAEYYSLDKAVPVVVNNNTTDLSFQIISINGVTLTGGRFNGRLFPDREYIFDGASKYSGFDVIGWEVSTTGVAGTEKKVYMDETLSMTFPTGTKQVTVNAIFGQSGIENIETVADVVETFYYNPQGMESPTPFEGLNIVKHILRDGKTVTVKKFIK